MTPDTVAAWWGDPPADLAATAPTAADDTAALAAIRNRLAQIAAEQVRLGAAPPHTILEAIHAKRPSR